MTRPAPPDTVAIQFDDAAQQTHAAMLGMWVFLATEVMLFGGLMTGYAVYRHQFPQAFAQASGHLYTWIGVGNTALLLLSSAFMAAAVQTPASRRSLRSILMLTTAALGLGFLGVKAVEYTLDVREGLLPVVAFHPAHLDDPAHGALFFVFYWILTALHAVHVSAGVGVIAVLAGRVRRSSSPERLSNAVEAAGLYWHFVDIVWIFLLPLLYLELGT